MRIVPGVIISFHNAKSWRRGWDGTKKQQRAWKGTAPGSAVTFDRFKHD